MSGKYKDSEILIREAKKEDIKAVAGMIQELANYQKMPNGPKISAKELERDGFERQPPAFLCKVAEVCNAESQPLVGFALYFPTYSPQVGRTLALQGLYVRPGQRRRGAGERLFQAVVEEASATGCSRLDFHVLEWNPARTFYEGKGAVNLTHLEQWCYYRLSGDALRSLATNVNS